MPRHFFTLLAVLLLLAMPIEASAKDTTVVIESAQTKQVIKGKEYN